MGLYSVVTCLSPRPNPGLLQEGNSAAGNGRSERAGKGLQVKEVTVWGQQLVYCLEQELEERREGLEKESEPVPGDS